MHAGIAPAVPRGGFQEAIMSNLLRGGLAGTIMLVVLAGSPATARAQEGEAIPVPVVEVAAGYTFMHDFSDLPEDTNFPAGWYSAVTFNVTRWFGIVGEATGSYKNDLTLDLFDVRFTNDVRLYTLMAGPRFAQKRGRMMPYGQFLVGAARARVTSTFDTDLLEYRRLTVSDTEFAFQPGGGVTIFLNDRVGVRVGADYRCIVDFTDETSFTNEFRFVTGFTFNWGQR
jgi:opacity protein-like surface antigen